MSLTRWTRALFPAVAGVAAWAADPAWAAALGVDVWNVNRLHAERREADDLGRWWDDYRDHMHTRFERNRLLVDGLIAGRPLPEVAARAWAENRGMPGYRTTLDTHHYGPTDEARAAHNLIVRVVRRLDPADRRAAAVVARLRAEYRAAYGVDAPAVD